MVRCYSWSQVEGSTGLPQVNCCSLHNIYKAPGWLIVNPRDLLSSDKKFLVFCHHQTMMKVRSTFIINDKHGDCKGSWEHAGEGEGGLHQDWGKGVKWGPEKSCGQVSANVQPIEHVYAITNPFEMNINRPKSLSNYRFQTVDSVKVALLSITVWIKLNCNTAICLPHYWWFDIGCQLWNHLDCRAAGGFCRTLLEPRSSLPGADSCAS